MTELMIERRKNKKNVYEYIVDENADLGLTRRQLSILLTKVCKMEIHEIAFLYDEWERNPHHTRGFFGMAGNFLFTN